MKKVIIIIIVCVIVIEGIILGIKIKSGKSNKSETDNKNYDNIIDDIVSMPDIETNSKASKMTDTEYYEKAVNFVRIEKSKDEDNINNTEDYKKFAEYEGFGVDRDINTAYAYMWIEDVSYYKEDGKIREGPRSSTAYKVEFKDGEVVKYEIPKEGDEREDSIKKMFPEDIAKKILKYKFNSSKIEKAVKEYYKE